MSLNINLDLKSKTKFVNNFFSHVHFHPTDAIEDDWGRKIIDRMASDKSVKRIRIYTMFEDIVTISENGELLYDYTLTDYRIDYLVKNGFELLICFNFMPLCIAKDKTAISHLERYKDKKICFSAPKDYKLWQEICAHYTKHLIERYGKNQVTKWYFHCWNEPDHHYWMNNIPCTEFNLEKAEEYVKLYDYFATGVTSVCPEILVGGPAAAGQEEFLEYFLNHIANDLNFATGKKDIRFDFFSMHTYETLSDTNPAVTAKIGTVYKFLKQLKKHSLENKPIVMDEWGAMVNGFVNFKQKPVLELREKTYLSAYYAKFIDLFSKEITEKNLDLRFCMFCLAGQHTSTYDFDGYRSFFTLNGYAKPIYNAYTMCAKLGEEQYTVDVNDKNVGCVATKTDKGYAILLYNFEDDTAITVPTRQVKLSLANIFGEKRICTYIIDTAHSSGYDEFIRLGKPEVIDADTHKKLVSASALFSKTEAVECDGNLELEITLEQNASVLIEIE